jgi:hypothetical protein
MSQVPGHHVGSVCEDASHDAEVAEHRHQDDHAQHANLINHWKGRLFKYFIIFKGKRPGQCYKTFYGFS